MPEITFVTPEGERVTIDASVGQSVMRAATSADVPGIIGECGGTATCGTCHVYVNEELLPGLPAMTSREDDVLEGVFAERLPTSRLGCQLTIDEGFSGADFRVPEEL